MGVFASEVKDFVSRKKDGLGTALSGRFSDLEIDSVEEVREIRED